MNRVQPVTVGVVRQQDLRVTVNAIGNVSALNTATVRTRVEGELKAIRFREGQVVRAGQLLAEVDPRAYEVALALAQAQLARDTAQLRNAQVDLDRYKDLLAKDSIASQQVDTQDALVRQLQATVQATQANVDNARLQLSYTRITAPISGRLGLKLADLGNTVRPGDANGIVTITQTQPISLVFALPEANLSAVNRKLRRNEPLTVEAWDREQRNLLATGRVTTTDNAIDAATGTIRLKAEFPNADGALFPNQFVNIRLQLDTLENAVSVPANAIQRGAMGIFVYVVRDDNTVTVRRVRPGAADGGWISVQGELKAGERVVTDGADRLREGAKVDVITPPQRPGGGVGAGAGPGAGPGPAAGAGPGAPGGAAAASPGTPSRREAGPPGAGATSGKAPATAPPATTAPTTAPPSGGPPAADSGAPQPDWSVPGTRPPWLGRLPPEVQERFMNMNQEQRRVFLERLRERRRQMQEAGQLPGGAN